MRLLREEAEKSFFVVGSQERAKFKSVHACFHIWFLLIRIYGVEDALDLDEIDFRKRTVERRAYFSILRAMHANRGVEACFESSQICIIDEASMGKSDGIFKDLDFIHHCHFIPVLWIEVVDAEEVTASELHQFVRTRIFLVLHKLAVLLHEYRVVRYLIDAEEVFLAPILIFLEFHELWDFFDRKALAFKRLTPNHSVWGWLIFPF